LHEACLEGEQNASTALKSLLALGVPAVPAKRVLDYDPIPAGGDVIEKLR
jgi:hypothetical protein